MVWCSNRDTQVLWLVLLLVLDTISSASCGLLSRSGVSESLNRGFGIVDNVDWARVLVVLREVL